MHFQKQAGAAINNMDPNMMQAPQAPQQPQQAPQQEAPNPEDQLRQQVMQMVDEIMAEWQKTGKIDGQKVPNEKEAKKLAVTMALNMIEQQNASQQNQQAPQQAPPPQGMM